MLGARVGERDSIAWKQRLAACLVAVLVSTLSVMPDNALATVVSALLEGRASLYLYDEVLGTFILEDEREYQGGPTGSADISRSTPPLLAMAGSSQSFAQSGNTFSIASEALASFVRIGDPIPLTEEWRIGATATAQITMSITEASLFGYVATLGAIGPFGSAFVGIRDAAGQTLRSDMFSANPESRSFSTLLLPGEYTALVGLVVEQDNRYYDSGHSDSIGGLQMGVDFFLAPAQVPIPGTIFLILIAIIVQVLASNATLRGIVTRR